MTAATVTYAHIVLDDRGRPWIDGTGTKVVEVVLDKLAHDWTAEQIHRCHPHLGLAQIHAALSYYYDHRDEIDAEIARQLAKLDAVRAGAGESPLADRARRERDAAAPPEQAHR